MDEVPEMAQLRQAKSLAMENKPGEMLPKVLETTASMYRLPETSANLKKQLARFFPELLLDTITHSKVPTGEKPFIAASNIDFLWQLCSSHLPESSIVYQYCTLAFSACYPLLFDLVAKTSDQKLWEVMQEMKQFIISKWKTPYPYKSVLQSQSQQGNDNEFFLEAAKSIGPKMATAKFISQIVMVHTSNGNSNSESAPQNGFMTSISSVPNNHPVISNKPQLESEAKKLLDVLLNYLIEEPMMVSSLFVGILNCLAFIMKQRPQATVRILSGLLKFNVDAKYQLDNTSALNYKLAKRFVERCYKDFVQYGLKSQLIKNLGQIATFHAKLSKISQTLHVIGEETKSKGILNFDEKSTENFMPDSVKQKYLSLARQKMHQDQAVKQQSHSLPPQPSLQQTSLAQAQQQQSMNVPTHAPTPPVTVPDNSIQVLMGLQKYTMSKNSSSAFFNTSAVAFDNSYSAIYSLMNSKHSEQDVSKYPLDVMIQLCSEAFYKTDTAKMISGLSIVASRYTELMAKCKNNAGTQAGADPVESSISGKRKLEDETDEQSTLKRPNTGSQDDQEENEEALDDFEMDDKNRKTEVALAPARPMTEEDKFKHLSNIIDRIMSIKDLDDSAKTINGTNNQEPLQAIKLVHWNNKESWLQILTRLAARGTGHNERMSETIRQELYKYLIEDYSNRVAMIIEWLNEEWFYETQAMIELAQKDDIVPTTYNKWSLKLLEDLVPFLENQHRRMYIRLLSELPHLSQEHIDRVRPICLDPARSSLGFQSLKFLVLFRPPTKPYIKNLLEKLKEEDTTVAEQCEAILEKFY